MISFCKTIKALHIFRTMFGFRTKNQIKHPIVFFQFSIVYVKKEGYRPNSTCDRLNNNGISCNMKLQFFFQTSYFWSDSREIKKIVK